MLVAEKRRQESAAQRADAPFQGPRGGAGQPYGSIGRAHKMLFASEADLAVLYAK